MNDNIDERLNRLENEIKFLAKKNKKLNFINFISFPIGALAISTSLYTLENQPKPAPLIAKNINKGFPDINARSIHFFNDNGKETAKFENGELFFEDEFEDDNLASGEPAGTKIDRFGLSTIDKLNSLYLHSGTLTICRVNNKDNKNDYSNYNNTTVIAAPNAYLGSPIEIFEKTGHGEDGKDQFASETLGKYGLNISDENGGSILGSRSLFIHSDEGHGEITVGEGHIMEPDTGSHITTSIGSIIISDKSGKIIWRTP